jgi:hypothetical protein
MIFLDFETDVGTGEPVVLTYRPEGGRMQIVAGREAMARVAREACDVGYVAHGAAFDSRCISQLIGERAVVDAYDAGRVACTMTGAILRDIRTAGRPDKRGYGLDLIAKRLGGLELVPDKQNPWRLRFGELRDVPLEAWPLDALEYVRADVDALGPIWAAVRDEVDLHRQSVHDYWLSLPGRTGVRTDPVRVAALAAALERQVADARRRAAKVFRADGTRDMKAIEAEAVASGITETTATGRVATGAEALAAAPHPTDTMRALAEYAHYNAHLTRLLPQLQRGRLTCRYKLAATGRAVASGTKEGKATVGTNIQNLPRVGGYRECLVPDEDDHVFVIADFTGLELATFAEILAARYGGSTLAASLRAGLDGHLVMAARLAGCSLDAMVAAYRGELGPDAQARAKAHRQAAKGPNFGFPGGLGPGGFIAYMRAMAGQTVDMPTAMSLRAEWLASDPCYARYLSDAGAAALQELPIVAYRTGRVRGSTLYTEHANTPFQALGADIAKACGWELHKATLPGGALHGSRIAIFAHDEFVLSTPYELREEHAAVLEHICGEVSRRFLSHVPLAIEPVIAARWSKKAKRLGKGEVWDDSTG